MSDRGQQRPAADGSGNEAAQPAEEADNASSGSSPLPESHWLPFINDCYPHLHEQSYFFTPLHVNHVPFSVQSMAGKTVAVYEELPCNVGGGGKRGHNRGTTHSHKVAGSMFINNPRNLKQEKFQESDMRDDDAQQRVLQCLWALSKNSEEAMMIILQLKFQNYLSKLDNCNPNDAAAAQSLPNLSRFSKDLADGECDILGILHCHGFFIGEIKSVGAADHFKNSSPENQNNEILKAVKKGMKQLNNQDKVVTQLVSDSPHKVTKALILPNLTSTQLKRALSTADAQVVKDLCHCLKKAPGVATAVEQCLCADQMPSREDLHKVNGVNSEALSDPFDMTVIAPLSAWWQQLLQNVGQDPNMSNGRYEQLVARFCGPATTVEVPTLTGARKVIRRKGEAVAETGLMMAHLALYPEQVNLLNRVDLQSVYLWGPPGCGKTVLLVLKAVELLQESEDVQVIVMNICIEGFAVSVLIEEQIRQSFRPENDRIQRLSYNLLQHGIMKKAGDHLVSLSQDYGRIHIIVDEVEHTLFRRNHFADFFNEVRSRAPNVSVWAAGVFRPTRIPTWMPVERLSIPLRCPPVVHDQVMKSTHINGSITPLYSQRPAPAPTDGPEIRWLKHKYQDCHGGRAHDCKRCGQNIAKVLKEELNVGQNVKDGLQWHDVFILCDDPGSSQRMVKALEENGVPVKVVLHNDVKGVTDMALARSNVVTVTDFATVSGLERRVVVGMRGMVMWGERDRNGLMSRSTAQLVYIDIPGGT